MQINWNLVVEFINDLAWPVITLVALFLFRKPLTDLLFQIARRAQKLTVSEVSVEFATLPELSPSWSIGSEDVRRLTSSNIFDSGSLTLFQELSKPGKADFAVVDLGSGEKWLTSRLFIFALILGSVTGLKAFVFLENAGGIRKKFLGVVSPTNIQKALITRYPWLEEAYLHAAAALFPTPSIVQVGVSKFSNLQPLFSGIDPGRLSTFVKNYIENLQRGTDPPELEKNSYLQIGSVPPVPPVWERARWIDGDRLERYMEGYLENSWCEDSPDKDQNLLIESILRRKGDFVALVDSDRRFTGLVDRNALLSQVWKQRESERRNTDHTKTG
jgi:hypothetical protein